MTTIRGLLFASVVVLFSIGSAHAFFNKPLTELTKGQKGKINFVSQNYKTFADLFQKQAGKEAKIKGILTFPKDTTARVPAAVLLHGVGGLKYEKDNLAISEDLNASGIATFIVDSQGPRGVSSPRSAMKKISDPMRISDAYAALRLLSTHPKINSSQIAVIGFSQGGRLSLVTSAEKLRTVFIDDDLRFAAHLSYFPSCFLQLHEDVKTTGSPILMLLAEKDTITPAQMCLDWAGRLRSSGAAVETEVYAGAAHAWLSPSLSGKTATSKALKNYSNCQDRYIQVKEDGTLYVPYAKKSIEKIGMLVKLLDDCKQGTGEKGDPTKVREASIQKGIDFLKQSFDME